TGAPTGVGAPVLWMGRLFVILPPLALTGAARIDSIRLHRSCGLFVTNSPHVPTTGIAATMICIGARHAMRS
ncbi:hypothetical protein, partial [Bradyrhizobium sp. SZCCHNS30592]|uniref:hypothetical protein n=1 Tax=Bradyrhizobium sp. SZCCHNS30592 TaxID=3057329 RepID=UPI00291659B6